MGRKKPTRKATQEPKIIEATQEEVEILYDSVPAESRANVVFEPNPGPQSDFLSAPEREVLYGGAAGGGKTYGMVSDPLRYAGVRAFSGLLLRRTTDELREIVSVSKDLYPLVYPGAKWSERKSLWTFPSGAELWMTYLERDEDVRRYQGQAFCWIGMDELTQYPTPYPWTYLRSRLRTVDKSLPIQMRATTNPGGPGHAWVKKMFIDPSPYNTPFWATDLETGNRLEYPSNHTKAGQPLFKRKFIQSFLHNNPYLAEDGEYESNLLSMPEVQRKQLLEGSWDVAEGAAFTEWNREVHVTEPFDIPHNWVKFRACDYGYGSYSAVLWFAISPSGQLVVYRELYVSKVLAVDLAEMILELEEDDGQIYYGVLDSSLWHNRGDTGPSLAEQMISKGCRWRPSDRSKGSRIAGKNELHRRLQVDEFTGEADIVFFNTCVHTIAQLPILPLDKKNPEDIDTKSEDHIYDALRYGIMSRPRGNLFSFQPSLEKRGGPMADAKFGY